MIKYQNKSDMGGLFLVRDSTVSDTDFSLSLTTEGRTYHFQIQEKKEGYFHIDDGPLVHGKCSSFYFWFMLFIVLISLLKQ